MKRTRIVCTIGPASSAPSTMEAMLRAGMDIARLNFSHGTHQSHAKLMRDLRKSAKKVGKPFAILGDLQGPKIRLGDLPEEGVELKKGKPVKFSTAVKEYKKGGALPVTYKNLHKDVKKGDRFLIDDGLLELQITHVNGQVITAKVLTGGKVSSHKGMNFPDSTLKVSSITAKDKKDIEFGVKSGVDWLALSFVTAAKDVRQLRKLIDAAAKRGQVQPKIIVKIEKHEAIANFKEILKETDAVMVARGDLGIEIDAEDVPLRQKEIIEQCRLAGKPVVVATQMLDSMIRNPRPTRAEVSDVANAVIDHADGVMLSGESATGEYPLKAVKMMARIVKETEDSPFDDIAPPSIKRAKSPEFALSTVVAAMAQGRLIDGVIAPERAGWMYISMLHPEIPLFLACNKDDIARQYALHWGAKPFVVKDGKNFRSRAISTLKTKKWIKKGMRLAMIYDGGKPGMDLIDIT